MADALLITFIGMGITFAAIVLLWWMMAGLTAFPVKADSAVEDDDTVSPDTSNSPQPAEADEKQIKAKAAAAAVAIALAEQELSSAHPLPTPPTALVSAWQLGTRSRQLYEKGKRR